MNILVVGNGFDLAHGLPTTYMDFLLFCDEVYSYMQCLEKHPDCKKYHIYYEQNFSFFESFSSIYEVINIYKEYYSCSKEYANVIDFLKLQQTHHGLSPYYYNIRPWNKSKIKKYIHSSANFFTIKEKAYNNLLNNVWYDYFVSIINSNDSGENWVDFESEIRYIIETVDKSNRDLMSTVKINDSTTRFDLFRSAFINAKGNDLLSIPLSVFIYDTANDLDRLIRCLEFYLCFINETDIDYISPDIRNSHIDAVLSFNYTNTYHRLYDTQTRCHFIHGQAIRNTSSCNMVLGVNEYWNGDERNTNSNFNQFKKFVQRILKGTGIEYKHWVNRLTPNNILIFGHSLDITDRDILIDLITHSSTISTTIFYHNKQQQAQQIANLSKILGQDILLEYVFSANPKIIFKQQQDMQLRKTK